MKRLEWIAIVGWAVFLGGCVRPACRQPAGKSGADTSVTRPSETGMVAPSPAPSTSPSTVVSPGVTPSPAPAPGPADTGKAAPKQIVDAGAGKDVPPVAIPPETRFVSPSAKGPEEEQVFKKIHFKFDDYSLTPEAQEILRGIADYLLKKNTTVKVMIEGHCDERGTREYNLVLGEQRALSARRYLVSLGVAPERLFTVSYGEDRPEDPGTGEEAWAKNRRCEFLLSAD